MERTIAAVALLVEVLRGKDELYLTSEARQGVYDLLVNVYDDLSGMDARDKRKS